MKFHCKNAMNIIEPYIYKVIVKAKVILKKENKVSCLSIFIPFKQRLSGKS